MSKQINIEPHLRVEELQERYRQAKEPNIPTIKSSGC